LISSSSVAIVWQSLRRVFVSKSYFWIFACSTNRNHDIASAAAHVRYRANRPHVRGGRVPCRPPSTNTVRQPQSGRCNARRDGAASQRIITHFIGIIRHDPIFTLQSLARGMTELEWSYSITASVEPSAARTVVCFLSDTTMNGILPYGSNSCEFSAINLKHTECHFLWTAVIALKRCTC
jgi:hypothetical protein